MLHMYHHCVPLEQEKPPRTYIFPQFQWVGEKWWARQDSNLQPDRYERPALTN